jgi:hypothetical protein
VIFDVEIPQNHEVERRLLGALLLLAPSDRDEAVKVMSAVWFLDPWHRRFFEVLRENRGRDFGAEMLDAMNRTDCDRAAWWISQLFLDRAGEPTTNPQSWREYAFIVERCYRLRIEVLLSIETMKEKTNAVRLEAHLICDAPKHDAKVPERPTGVRLPIVVDGAQLS